MQIQPAPTQRGNKLDGLLMVHILPAKAHWLAHSNPSPAINPTLNLAPQWKVLHQLKRPQNNMNNDWRIINYM